MKSHSQPQGKKFRIKGKERRRGRKGRGKRAAGCRGQALCDPCAHPAGMDGSLSPQDTATNPGPTGQAGRPWPPSSQSLARASPQAEPRGTATILGCPGSISGFMCPADNSFSHLPAPLLLSKLSRQAMLNAPPGCPKPLPFLPRHPNARAGARPGRSEGFEVTGWPGQTCGTARATAGTCTAATLGLC